MYKSKERLSQIYLKIRQEKRVQGLCWPTVVLPLGSLKFNANVCVEVYAEVVAAKSETLQNYTVLSRRL